MLVTAPVRIWSEVPTRNDALTWIWGASCVPQVAFHAARPGRDRGWGWWQDSGHSRCRSSTRSPGAGGASAGSCGTQRHISSIRFSTTNLQAQSDNTNSHTRMQFHTHTLLLEECIHRIPPGAWIFVCCECRVLSGRGLCDELITRPEESYRFCCVVVCDLETSRIGAPYIYDISRLKVNNLTLILLTWRKW